MSKARIALVGMPNTGKSTLFNRLSGASARVGNWPGMTVELEIARLLVGARMVELVDLPGLNNLHGFSEDERIARHFLETQPLDALIVVLNATQIERQLAFALQIKQLGLPLVLVLNMADEAIRRHVLIDREALEKALGHPVCLISAKYGHGTQAVRQALETVLHENAPSSDALQPRSTQIQALLEDDNIELQTTALLAEAVRTPQTPATTYTDRIDSLLLHPGLGIVAFFFILLGLFQIVYSIGAPLQELLGEALEGAKTDWIAPLLAPLPAALTSFLLDGLYDGVGTVATFLPIILTFYLVMSAVEDSGYMARAAFLMDALMSRMGLDGRAFVMQIMGFGCNVPAVMGTRVLRNPLQRRLSMLIIPFSLCSARLQVFLFFTTAVFSPQAAPWVLLSFYVLSFLVAFLTAFIWRGQVGEQEPLVMELPPYRYPTFTYLALQALREAGQFLRGAGGFIIAGVAIIWLLTHLPWGVTPASPQSWAGQIASLTAPLFEPLGINNLLSIALMFGFVAKEVVVGALAVIYGAGPNELAGVVARSMDWRQAYSFMLFTLLYTPCLATLATIRRESRSLKFTLASMAWSVAVAWLASFAFYQIVTR
ncbi:MAG: ferrous iron transport protein B [Betaproteobacteria bacterium]|nr:ferrous iron transport protein B [Betaproteobacteria bacterium]